MEQILKQLQEEILSELKGNSQGMESLGTADHQLKLTIETALKEVQSNENYNPFELTNRVLLALNRCNRLRT